MKTNAALAIVAAAMLLAMEAATGRIPVNGGRGFDGTDYAAMLDDLGHGAVDAKMRPAIVVINRPAYEITDDAIEAFQAMNYLYAGLLSWFVCVLFDRYAAGAAASWTRPALKALLIANLFASIAVAQYPAFYPVLVDLGALALILAAIVLHLSGRRAAAAAAAVAAVLAREFALAVVAFGIVRDLRLRVPVKTVVATWLPAPVTWIAWRMFVASSAGGGGPLGAEQFAENLAYWRDPLFAALFVYFLLTIFGGITLVVVARARLASAHVVREPEWAVYALLVLAAAAAGDADLWRYLAYLLPVVVVLFAVVARDLTAHRRFAATAVVLCAATVVTQRPFQPIDMTAYFLDWFPYYIRKGDTLPMIAVPPSLWPVWGWRFLSAGALLVLLMAVPARSSRMQTPSDLTAQR
jgi:hypothetical protein